MVPEDRLVVLTMRIGLFGWPDGVKGPAGISDRKKLYDVVEGRDVLALVGARSRGRVPRNWRQCTGMASEAPRRGQRTPALSPDTRRSRERGLVVRAEDPFGGRVAAERVRPITTMHLWKAELPADLEPGAHTVTVTGKHMFDQKYRRANAFETAPGRNKPGPNGAIQMRRPGCRYGDQPAASCRAAGAALIVAARGG